MEEHIQYLMGEYVKKGKDFAPQALNDPGNKWLVRSGLQKAIRRGRLEEALLCGALLFDCEEAYAWQGLLTIIIEDVGYPNFELMSVAPLAALKGYNKLHDRAKLFGGMIIEAATCEAKTRSCCELSLGTDLSMAAAKTVMKDEYSDIELLEALADYERSPQMHYLVLQELRQRGRNGGDALLTETIHLMRDQLYEKYEGVEDFNELVVLSPLMQFERPIDSMSYALYVLMMHGYYDDYTIKADTFPPTQLIKGLSACAYDMHTRPGAAAIKAFHTTQKAVPSANGFLGAIAPGNIKKAIGCAVFIEEGGLLNNRMRSPALDAMKVFQDTNFAKGYGLPLDTNVRDDIIEYVGNNIEILNEKREWAANLS